MRSKYRWLIFAGLLCLTSVDARAQACGFSVNTFYVVEDTGKQISDVKIEPVSSVSYTRYFREHFNQVTKIFRDKNLEAYVVLHGLCGAHRGVVLKFSAPGFETTEQEVEMPLGFRGYVLNIKKKGSKEQASISAISCEEEQSRCVKKLARDY